MDISIPTLIDDMTNEVNEAYAAHPDRLYFIDDAGAIAYRSGPGPFGFKPDEFEDAIIAPRDRGSTELTRQDAVAVGARG